MALFIQENNQRTGLSYLRKHSLKHPNIILEIEGCTQRGKKISSCLVKTFSRFQKGEMDSKKIY